jgi:DNA-binding NtrC family response regulator
MLRAMERCVVLLVDDDEDLLDAIGDLLRAEDLAVHVARTLGEAKALLGTSPVDVIVTDLDLGPDGSGEELLAFAARRLPHIGRILYSASAGSSSSADVVVDKPSVGSLVKAIRALDRARR